MFENHYRTVLKTISWRIMATVDTIIISYLITGKISLALSIGFFEFITKLILYYIHERLWNKINVGRVMNNEDYQI